MIELGVRFLLLFLSLGGYAACFALCFHFPKTISWIAACCFHILVLSFVAYGGHGWIRGTSWVLWGVGVVLYLLSYVYQRRNNIRVKKQPMMVWFYGYFGLLASTLYASHLIHYDNFSHWATIVKFLFVEDRLPTLSDTIISFTSYPLGSSLFLVYVTHIVGYHENVLLIAQLILIFSCMLSFFSVIRDHQRKLSYAILFTCLALFNYFNIAIRMNNLLVDFLLPLLTLSGFAGLFVLKKKPTQAILYFLLLGGTLGIIKNSSIFFFICLACFFLYCQWKNGGTWLKKSVLLMRGMIVVAVSLTPLLVWNLHVKTNFPSSKHEVSVTEYQQIFNEKNSEVLQQITNQFFKTIFDIHTISTQGFVLIQIVLIGMWCVSHFYLKKKAPFLKELFLLDSICFAYYAGIYAMFLFSMPTDEALTLAGFDRYASSIIIMNIGLAAFFIVRGIDFLSHEQNIEKRTYRSFASLQSKKIYQYATLLLLFVATLLVLSENNGIRYNNRAYEKTVPSQIAALAGQRFTLNDQKYLIVSTDQSAVDSYLVGYVGKYYFFSPNVDGRENFVMSDSDFKALLNQYDTVVILEDHYTFNAMTKKIFGHIFEPGVYSVKEQFGS